MASPEEVETFWQSREGLIVINGHTYYMHRNGLEFVEAKDDD